MSAHQNSPDDSWLAEDFVDPPAPPTAAEQDRAYIVNEVVLGLRQAAANQSPHWHLSHALESIRVRTSGRISVPLSAADREMLLEAIEDFRPAIDWLFQREHDVACAERGLAAMIVVMGIWSGHDVGQFAAPHIAADALAHLRIFHNTCFTISLESEIRERADRRTIAAVETMVKEALERTSA